MVKEFKLPDVGEGLTEADIVAWHVKPGDLVEDGQIIVEIETAKAVVELPCPWDGTVARLLAEEGRDRARVGAGQLDDGLRRLDVHDDLVDRHRVTGLDMPGDNVGLGEALPHVGEPELLFHATPSTQLRVVL